LESTIDLFSNWNTKHAGLFTFAQSPKHIALYQKFDFWPRFLTTIMSKNVISKEKKENNNNTANLRWSRYSELFGKKRELDNKQQRGEEENQEEGKYLDVCSRLTHAIYEGLDLRVEIMSVRKQELGDTVLLWDDENTSDDNYSKILVGIGICHCGAGSEAGSNTCYIKFGAVKPGPAAGNNFDKLLDACEAFAAEEGMSSIVAGVNTGRYEAYRKMLSRGFQIDILGIAMQRYNDSGYNKRNVYVIDDWR
jgi:hypothetical protein